METRAEYETQAPHLYLMDEHPHFFYPTLAERIGLNEAIVLQQIHSWIQTYLRDADRYREKHYHDGAWWTWDSYPDWHKKLPYLSESTIKRTLINLREKGLIRTGNYNTLKIDRTLWYTIDYGEYDNLWANPKYTDQEVKTISPSGQNDQMEETNLTSPLPVPSSVPSSVLEEPASPDSLEWPADLAALGEEQQEEEPFYLDGETPTQPAVPRSAEEHKAGIQRALEANARNGGKRAGVADPTKDHMAWTDVYYSFGDAFLGMDEDALDLKPNKDDLTLKLMKLTLQVKGGTEKACHVMKPLAVLEDWLVGPSATPYNTRWAEAFQNALITDIQVLKDRAVAKLKKADGGPSGPRQPQPTHVTPAEDNPWERIFDPETGRRRPEYQ